MAATLYGNGDFTVNGGLNIGAESPVDSRITVVQEEHLFELDTYKDIKLYHGMVVSAQDNGAIYVLMNKNIYNTLSETYLTQNEDGTYKTVADLTDEQKETIKNALKNAWKKVGADADATLTWGVIPQATSAE